MKHKIHQIRKRGADMTQALLYAAFAIIVLISVLAIYQVVTFNASKTELVNLASTVQNETRMMTKGRAQTFGITAQNVIDSGVIPSRNIGDIQGYPIIKLPYGGYMTIGGNGTTVQAGMAWTEPSRSAKNLCNFMAGVQDADPNGPAVAVEQGPMGSNYVVVNRCAEDNASFIVEYIDNQG